MKQISIFLENKKGRLAGVTETLAKGEIDIKAMSLADTSDFGILRLIVDDSLRCLEILKTNEYVAQENEVIGVEIEDRPGGMNRVLEIFENNGINIEYMYATVERNKDYAIVIFRVDNQSEALKVLAENNITVAGNSDII